MQNIKRALGILALLILISTISGVIYFRSDEASKETTPNLSDKSVLSKSVEKSKPVEDEPDVWGGLTIHKTGAELENARRVVVLLHGLGDRAESFSKIGDAFTIDDETCFIYPNAPINAGPGNAWFRGAQTYQPSRDMVVDLLKFIKQENPSVDIVLGGFSQGAMMSSNFLEKDVELLSAIILLAPSGRLRDDISGKAKDKPPVFLAHGRSDRVLPFQGSEQLHEKLVKHEYPVEWVPFDDGHTIPREVLARVDEFLEQTKEQTEKE